MIIIFQLNKAANAQQKKYVVGEPGYFSQTLDLKASGTLLVLTNSLDFGGTQLDSVSTSTVLIRLDNNNDTIWVKRLPFFTVRDCLLNTNNEIILIGGKATSVSNVLYSLGVQIIKMSLSGTILLNKYKFTKLENLTAIDTRIIASIVESDTNEYLVTLSGSTFGNSSKFDLVILRLNNNLDIITQRIIVSTNTNALSSLIDNRIVKKNTNQFIIYPKNTSEFIYSIGSSIARFLVIDSNLNNTFYKELTGDMVFIKSINIDNENIYIGGQARSNKLVANAFDTNVYVNHFITKVNLSNTGNNFFRALLFKVNFKAKEIQDKSYYYFIDNNIYVTNFSSGLFNSFNTLIHDSLSRNYRTTLFKIDSNLTIKWNNRLHVYGSNDTTDFSNNNIFSTNGLGVIDNSLIFKTNKILSLSYQTNYGTLTNQIRNELGYSLTAIDTAGNNAFCNATSRPILQKYDSLKLENLPTLNAEASNFQLDNGSQIILNIPLRSINNNCLPLIAPKSKFYWFASLSSGFDSVVCKDSKIFFIDRSYNEPKTWRWIFPPQANITDLDSLQLPNVKTISFNQAGIYPVSLVTQNDAGIDTSTQFITVINFIPQPNLGNDTLLCEGDTLKIIYQNPPNSLHYFTGPGAIYTTSDTLLITTTGQYEIAAYTACGFLYDTIVANFAKKPIANFGSAIICNSLNVIFTDSSILNLNPSLTYAYAFKPALAPITSYTNFSNNPNNNFTFNSYDSFDIRLIVTSPLNCVGKDTIVKRIVLKAKPIAGFTAINNCGSLQVAFTSTATPGTGSINLQQYFVGNTLIGTGANMSYNFANYGSYVVKHVAKNSLGCLSDTVTQTVVVKDKPLVNLTVLRDSVCANTNFTITANATVNATSISSYTWIKNNVLQPTITNQLLDNQPAGIYTYKVVATSAQNCKSDTAIKIITVASKPIATLTATNICGSKTIAIAATATVLNDNIANHFISYGDGNTSVANPSNGTYTYANYGTYDLKYVIKGSVGCSSDTVYQTIAVKDKPILNITYNNNACNNTDFILTAAATVNASSITNYTWLKDGIILPITTNIITQNNIAASYIYKVIATANTGCPSDTATLNVLVEKYPTTIFTAAGGCVGKNILITNTSINNNAQGAITYTWTTSDGQNSNAIIPNFSFATSGTKTIQLKTSTQNNCIDIITKTITVEDFPTADFTITEACLGRKITITNNSIGAVNYTWTTNNAQIDNNFLPNFIFNTIGNYSINLKVATPNNCTNAITKNTTIQAVQLFTTPGIDTNAVVNQPTQLAVKGAATYIWGPSNYLNNNSSANPIFTALVTGNYPLQIEGTTAQGCKGYANLTVKVFAENTYLWIPNAFTPNGDGLNDKLRITCSGLQTLTNFSLFNRYGELIYIQNTCNGKGWDGIFKGKEQPISAFVYTWSGINFKGEMVGGKGTVMLVR